jgi:hypothetical protein
MPAKKQARLQSMTGVSEGSARTTEKPEAIPLAWRRITGWSPPKFGLARSRRWLAGWPMLRQVAAEEQMDPPTTNDCVLAYMYKNFPRKDWTLDTYLMLAYLDGRRLEDLGPEELAELPAELYPPPETEEIQ